MRDLDETDLEILSLLAEDARRPFSEIGERVGLSGPAVSDRVTRLEETGVIQGFTVDVDIEFFLQGCFDVDVTEDPEAFVLQGSRDCGYDIVERCIDRCGDGVRHRSIECFWLPSSR
jgi:DNA-binding Lrp family transcriptional regulator